MAGATFEQVIADLKLFGAFIPTYVESIDFTHPVVIGVLSFHIVAFTTIIAL
ncbi:hypothetical protein KIPB_013881, partial [Kipferlia bialata]|eukprot:g13881.t1